MDEREWFVKRLAAKGGTPFELSYHTANRLFTRMATPVTKLWNGSQTAYTN